MTNYICASIKRLDSLRMDCEAQLIRAIWKARDFDELIAVYPLAESLDTDYYKLSLTELKKECVNHAADFHGVEYLGRHARTGQVVDYCNAGDTYAGTIAFIGNRLIVTTWGDMVERGLVVREEMI